jgi:hypothetical protein
MQDKIVFKRLIPAMENQVDSRPGARVQHTPVVRHAAEPFGRIITDQVIAHTGHASFSRNDGVPIGSH